MGLHRWSGWPGATCMLCHAEDALEIALADGWIDPCTNTWDTEEHKDMVMKAQNNCPHTKDGQDPYTVIWENGQLVTKERLKIDMTNENCKNV